MNSELIKSEGGNITQSFVAEAEREEARLLRVAEKSIEEIAKEAVPQICVVGVGGLGCEDTQSKVQK